MAIYKDYNHNNTTIIKSVALFIYNIKVLIFLGFNFPLLRFLESYLVFHLSESYLSHLKRQLLEELSEDSLEVFDRLDV